MELATKAARLAGAAIMEVYAQPFEVFVKDDASPVTLADLQASDLIKKTLEVTGLPFVSEEDLPPDRSGYDHYWLVDPLDGTQEFVNRNGEFTVNIALMEHHRPVMGVIYAPVTGQLWTSESVKSVIARTPKGSPTEREVIAATWQPEGSSTEGRKSSTIRNEKPFTVLVSRSHRTQEVDDYIDQVLRPVHPDLVIDSQGSSLKFARLVEDTADVYVCYSKTKEWDTAAADAILTAAGGRVLRISDGLPLEYDKPDYPNPPFVAWAPGKGLS